MGSTLLLCWWREFWYAIRFPFTCVPISGHAWRETEVHQGCEVSVLVCECCGKTEVHWREGQS